MQQFQWQVFYVVYSWICAEEEIGKLKGKTALEIARKGVKGTKQRGNTSDCVEGGEWRIAEDLNKYILTLYAALSLY